MLDFHLELWLTQLEEDSMSKRRPLVLPAVPNSPQAVRDQHIVSRFYLNKFADGQKYLFAYSPGQKPRRKSTKSLTCELDYFEYTVNGESTDNRYENWFQKIESDAAAVYSTIQSGSGFAYRNQEESWARFIASLFLRSRKVREQFGPKLLEMIESELFFGEDQVREMQLEFLKQGVFVNADDLRAKVNQVKNEMRAPAFTHLAGIEENVQTIAHNILDKRWFVLEAAPGTIFVTSDCPAQTASVDLERRRLSPGNGFRHPNTAVMLPLSPRKLFYAGPQSMVWKSPTLDVTDTHAFNRITIQFAHKAVFTSEHSSEIQSQVDQELNQVTYGNNAFLPLKKG
jgi:hypothetical protein